MIGFEWESWGLNGRGFALLKSLLDMRGDIVEVVALCDVDALVLGRRTTDYDKLKRRAKGGCCLGHAPPPR